MYSYLFFQEIMIINNKYFFFGYIFELVSSVKYVGIILNNNLNWMECICNI